MDNVAQKQQSGQVNSSNFQAPDVSSIITRVKAVLTNPKGVWSEIKGEPTSIKDIYLQYLIVLAAIPAICGFIGMTFIGITVPFIGTIKSGFIAGLTNGIVGYALSLASVLISAIVIENLAPKFGGNTNRTLAFKLVAYSATAGYVGGVLSIIPALSMLAIIFGIYSLYTYYQGIPEMTGVPDEKRLMFAAISIVCIFVVMLIIGLLSSILSPSPTMPSIAREAGDRQVDVQQIEEGLRELQKFIPEEAR